MRKTLIAAILSGAVLCMAGCDAPQDAVSKEMGGPEGPGAPDETVSELPVADTHHEPQEGERLSAHEHGRATLAAAVDADRLTFIFEAPLASLAGFEHEAQTEEQTAALAALKDAFVVPGAMVAVNASAGCLPLMTTSGTHMSDGHGALEVEHVYTCENPGRIDSFEFLMMGDYPALEAIDAVFLSGTGQSAGELRPGNPVLKIR